MGSGVAVRALHPSNPASGAGFSLIELSVAIGIMSVAVLGLAGSMAAGFRHLATSPAHVIAAQKATQAVEAVFAARDSHRLVWNQIRNVRGAGADGGVFLDGAQSMRTPGVDGLVNTADDGPAVEQTQMPGPDNILGTADDRQLALYGFTREIAIRDIAGENGQLRAVTVTITYQAGTRRESYVLSTYISSYA